MTTNHADLSGTNIHVSYAWSYADTSAREAASGMAAGDVGKFARQLDDNTIWILTDDDPVTWVQVGGSGSGAPTDANYVVGTANGSLSAEIVLPELIDLNASGATDIDMSGAATGTGISASLSNGLYEITFTNNSWQYWDVASAIGTGDFDVRCRLVYMGVTTNAAIYPPILSLILADSSRTASTGLNVIRNGFYLATDGKVPNINGNINGTIIGRASYDAKLPCILRMTRSGTTVSFYYSAWEGRTWVLLGTASSSLNIAKVGMLFNANTQTECRALVHWIRSY